MSAESLALLRKTAGQEISALGEEHFKYDLQDSDRDILKTDAGKIGTHVTIGSAVGLGLSVFLAFQLRRTRMQMFNAFQAHEKPTHVKFADGREGTSFPSINVQAKNDISLTLSFSCVLRSHTRCHILHETFHPRRRRCIHFLRLRRAFHRR